MDPSPDISFCLLNAAKKKTNIILLMWRRIYLCNAGEF